MIAGVLDRIATSSAHADDLDVLQARLTTVADGAALQPCDPATSRGGQRARAVPRRDRRACCHECRAVEPRGDRGHLGDARWYRGHRSEPGRQAARLDVRRRRLREVARRSARRPPRARTTLTGGTHQCRIRRAELPGDANVPEEEPAELGQHEAVNLLANDARERLHADGFTDRRSGGGRRPSSRRTAPARPTSSSRGSRRRRTALVTRSGRGSLRCGVPTRRIVLGLDGTPGSAAATSWCAAMAPALDAEVLVVNAMSPVSYLVPSASPADIPPIIDDTAIEESVHNELESELETWCAPLARRASRTAHTSSTAA